jgi:endoglucanase
MKIAALCGLVAWGCGLSCAGLAALGEQRQVVPPLHTDGYRIVDAAGRGVRLTSVNWYGFDQKEFVAGGLDHAPLQRIVAEIKEIGVNSVRLPWANETVEHDPVVAEYAVAANPQFKGKHAMEVMDAVVAALAGAHLMVILDNHMSDADWCCSETDKNGLWWNDAYPETKWLADWTAMARRYGREPWVVGADLRNELRSGAAWGGTDAKRDWHRAAERGGKAVLEANPRLLVMVESPEYSTNFAGFDTLPVRLPVAHRLVYSPHAYYAKGMDSLEALRTAYEARALFLKHSGAPGAGPATPLWVGEFGACQTLACGANGEWLKLFVAVLKENPELGWSYWPLNGTQSSGVGRKYDTVENYGLLSTDYQHIAAPGVVELLRTVEGQP